MASNHTCGMSIHHFTHFWFVSVIARGHYELFFDVIYIYLNFLHSLTLMPKRKLKPSSLQVNLSDYFGTQMCLKLEFDAFISYLDSIHIPYQICDLFSSNLGCKRIHLNPETEFFGFANVLGMLQIVRSEDSLFKMIFCQ